MLGCRFSQICQSKPGLGFSTRNSLIYSGFQPLRPFCPSTVWVITCQKSPPVSPKPVTVTHCWLQRTLVPSNVSLFAERRFMGFFTRETRFSHFGLQPTASLYHHCRCLTGFSHYGLQPTANYVTNLGASLVLATLASGPLLAASSSELLACSPCPLRLMVIYHLEE